MKNPFVTMPRLCIAGFALLVHSAQAQGPLAPPGPPAPMMKTLQEMEPRTHITAAGYTITTPGSYYLTTNLNGGGTQNGIVVQASGVTIDLRGFSIENCLVGITAASGIRNVVVANGIVRDCANTGVDLSSAGQCRLEGVMVSANGGDGARAGAGSLLTLCTASGNGGLGMILGDNGTVFRCVVQNNAGGGITIGSNCQATENTITGNGSGTGQAGLLANGNNNRVEGNSANSNNGQGYLINGTGNLVIRNNACSNAIADYTIASGNNYGQILLSPGSGFASSNAWANFGCGNQTGGCQTAADCNDSNPCTEDTCVASACVNTPIPDCCPDNDQDGYTACNGDCDDSNATINPGAGEVCGDGIDNDCDGQVDEGCGPAVCGNGITETGETCDDGNTNNGDGCSSTCQTEGGGGCAMDSQCNDNNPCTMDLCVAGACQFTISPNGAACNDGNPCTTGDVCVNGACTAGTPVSCNDGDPCTVDTCDGMGGCVFTPIPNCGQTCTDGSTQPCYAGPAGTAGVGVCQAGVQTCSGGAWGACVGQVLPNTEACDGLDNDCNGIVDENGVCGGTCATASDCPGQDTDCKSRTCTQGVCGFTFQAAGTPTGSQVSGDCASSVCDGAGGIMLVSNNSDLPASDGNQCTSEVCINGSPAYQNLPSGTACTQNGGTVCDGNGSCVSYTFCGDGLVQGTEACDDANQINGDGCSASCTVEPGYSCAGSPSTCTAGNCMDGIKNGIETGVDCGGGSCPACGIGQGCSMASDCQSGVCSGGVCVSN